MSRQGNISMAELLAAFAKDAEAMQVAKLRECVCELLACSKDGETAETFLKSSDLLSAVNLLVQQLLIRLNKAFVEPTRFAVDHATLRQFLLQDCTLLLLITIYLVGLQTEAYHPEMVELLLLVLKALLSKELEFSIDQGTLLSLVPLHTVSQVQLPQLPASLLPSRQRSTAKSVPSSHLNTLCVPTVELMEAIEGWVLRGVAFSEQFLYLLLLSIVEGSGGMGRRHYQGSVQLSLLQGLSGLFDDMVGLWLKDSFSKEGRTEAVRQQVTSQYTGFLYLARIVLRMWLTLYTNVVGGCPPGPHPCKANAHLCSPVIGIYNICSKFQEAMFKGNVCRDQEFALIVLESFLTSVHIIVKYGQASQSHCEHFGLSLKACLSESFHEWFAYLCTKLFGIMEGGGPDGTSWKAVVDYCCELYTELLQAFVCVHAQISTHLAKPKSLVVSKPPAEPEVVCSAETCVKLGTIVEQLHVIAAQLLNLFSVVPSIQFLALSLLSLTTKDPKDLSTVIVHFLSNLPKPAVLSNPEVFDNCLELLEGLWFRLTPDLLPLGPPFWEKLTFYCVILCGTVAKDTGVKTQLLHHLQCLYNHKSPVVRVMLTKHIVVGYYNFLMKGCCSQDASDEGTWPDAPPTMGEGEKAAVTLFLKILAKVCSCGECLKEFAALPAQLYQLFLFLPYRDLRPGALAVIEQATVTLAQSSDALFRHNVNILLKLAYTLDPARRHALCLELAEGKLSVRPQLPRDERQVFRDVTEAHMLVQQTFEGQPPQAFLKPLFVHHLGIAADIWGTLRNLAFRCRSVVDFLSDHGVFDVTLCYSPCVGGLLTQLSALPSEEMVPPLQQCIIALLSYQVEVMMCLLGEAHQKKLEMYCSELQTSLMGSRLCSIPNAQRYCIALLRVACLDTSEPSKDGTPLLHDRQAAVGQLDLKAPLSAMDAVAMDAVAMDNSDDCLNGSDMETSGYEGDTDGGEESSDSCKQLDDSRMLQSVTQYLVPKDIRKPVKLWVPVLYCVELVRECVDKMEENCEQCLQIVLYNLYALVHTSHHNVNLFSTNGLMETLLDAFAPLFESDSERSIACCRLICNICEVLAVHKVSINEVRKLFQRLQVKKVHLEQLLLLLWSVAQSSADGVQPSAYVQFNYKKSSDRLDIREMLIMPAITAWGLEPCSLSMWLSVTKYPLQATFHLISVNMGPCFLQLFASALTGDVLIRMTSGLQLDTPDTNNIITLGSVFAPNRWHHLLVTVFPPNGSSQSYKLLAVVDGTDVFRYSLVPPLYSQATPPNDKQYFVAGGAVSTFAPSEKHLQLIQAENTQLAWKLASLSVLKGISNPSVATLLYLMGPNGTCTNREVVQAALEEFNRKKQFQWKDASKQVITDEDIKSLLQEPFLVYSGHDSLNVHMTLRKSVMDGDQTIQVPNILQLQWVSSAVAHKYPKLLDVILSAAGMEQLIYLYAKIVGEGCVEILQQKALALIQMGAQSSLLSAMEFEQLDGSRLIQQVLRTPKASVGPAILEVLMSWCCGKDYSSIQSLPLCEHVLLDWRIWHKATEEVWGDLLAKLEAILDSVQLPPEYRTKWVVKLLQISKERSVQDSLPLLPLKISMHLVRLLQFLTGQPPLLECLTHICNHLLVSDVNDTKLVTAASVLESSIVAFDANHCSTPTSHDSPTPVYIPVPVVTNDHSPEPEDLTFDVQPVQGRLPDSTYFAVDDALFTWADITGQNISKDSTSVENVRASLETGLLGVLKKVIMLMPDSFVPKVIGPVIQHDSLIAIAHNPSMFVRAAVVGVLDEYFKRGDDSLRTAFLHMKGFDLLSNQLKQFGVCVELMNALCSMLLAQQVNLGEMPGSLIVPETLAIFNMHLCIPILDCTPGTVGHQGLCHAVLVIIRELFEHTRGVAAFMLNNTGLLRVLCQLVTITADHALLSRREKAAILEDVFQMCKLVVCHAFSSEQEEQFAMFQNLLACLRHCYVELQKSSRVEEVSVICLHHCQLHNIAQALALFLEEPTRPAPPSIGQVLVQGDQSNRFFGTCTTAVEWVLYTEGQYTSEHAQYFVDQVAIENLVPSEPVSMALGTVAFVRYLLGYFHRYFDECLHPPKGGLARQRFSSLMTQLQELYCRLLAYLLNPTHCDQVKEEVLKQVWRFESTRVIIESLLASSYKKLLGSRLVLTIVQLLTGQRADTAPRVVLNEIFDMVVQRGPIVTKLRADTRLSHLVEEEVTGPSQRQNYKALIEEMRELDQRLVERYKKDIGVFAVNQNTQYKRLVDKFALRQKSVSESSHTVTTTVLERQYKLRKEFLDQVSQASYYEWENVRQWRKLVVISTHPRALWYRDERRTMWWQLDPTEGPGRMRKRLMRAPCFINDRHLLPEARGPPANSDASAVRPLAFIFDIDALTKKVVTNSKETLVAEPQRCNSISPDNCCGGSIIITNRCCYFHGEEPLGDPNYTRVLPWDDEASLFSWEHAEVLELHTRRYMLKNNALEVFLSSGRTVLLAFGSTKERNDVFTVLRRQTHTINLQDGGDADEDKLKAVMASWQHGEITNFEYLMELNKLAGRTFNDLMQYPVFPFILADYYSKELDLKNPKSFRKLCYPISIQNEEKTKKYVDTYNFLLAECARGPFTPGLPQQFSKPYHYGSHYSNSGIVLHFMVRVPPFTEMFLAFQGRNFDIADRTFRKLATTWLLSSSESATDVKELIPEFFYFPEFLLNQQRLAFGECQDGTMVDNVELPPWAQGDARLFVLKHRQALESDYVSDHLHEWIDLVFGYKQTGKAAVQAINVFHPATYYGNDGIDFESVTDPCQQAAVKAMVKTYGQMPLQLFREAHPPRDKASVLTLSAIRNRIIEPMLKRFGGVASPPPIRATGQHFWMNIDIHKTRPSHSMSECDYLGEPHGPDLNHTYRGTLDTTPERIVYMGSGEVVVTKLKAFFFPSSSPSYASILVTCRLWDNSLHVYSAAREYDTLKLHPHLMDTVNCCECVCNGQIILSGGSAGVLSCWMIVNSQEVFEYKNKVVYLRGHDGAIIAMAACRPFSIVVTGSTDRTCIIWDTNRLSYVNSLGGHEGPVHVIATSPTLGDIATVCTTTSSSKPGPCVLRVWTVNGRIVNRVNLSVLICSLIYTCAPEGVCENVLIGGMADGTIYMWGSWNLSPIRQLPCPFEPSPVLSIAISSCSKEIYAGYSCQKLAVWVKPKSPDDVNFAVLGKDGVDMYRQQNPAWT